MPANLETYLNDPSSPIEEEIARLSPWFHNLHLPDGAQTARNHPLGDFPRFKWLKIAHLFPQDLTDHTVLDIGCNAGFYSFEFAARGAQVLGVDVDPHYLRQAEWGKNQLGFGDSISFKPAHVYELGSLHKKFNIVLFMGLFYHLRYPLLALDIVANLFTDTMVFQTLTMPGDEILETPDEITIDDRNLMIESGWPKMAFIENKLEGDPTNWWAPNHSGVLAMLRSSGLEVFAKPAHEIYLCRKTQPILDHMHEYESGIEAACKAIHLTD